ncbi:MAG: minor capsid protein [Hyphomicrobiales bacterium]|nr:minor capsid protein [Hyphomicrobiales bacterium]
MRKAIGAAARRIGDGHHHDGVEAAAAIVLAYEPRIAARLAQACLSAGRLTLDLTREGKRGLSPYEAAVAKWAKQHAASKIVEISNTTRKQINRVLTAGVKKGATNAAIAKDVREILGGRSAAARAERIARTETHTAAQVGSEAAARSTGLDMVGEWAAVEDARTRPAHAAADGQVIELGGTFTVGGEQLRYPGDPNGSAENIINCRCVALWRLRRDGE